MLPIAIDVMSGDQQPREYVAGALRALHEDPELRALLVGDASLIERELHAAAPSARARLEVVATTEVVAMGDSPREAIRRKKNSSMRVAIDLVKEGQIGRAHV